MSKARFLLLAFGKPETGPMTDGKVVENARATPRQRRSRATVDAILEAAAQVLEASGEAGFNTNAVAERAGVGVGSLYRYFPDKRAILVALGRSEMERVGRAVTDAMASAAPGVAPDRAAIRAFLHAFGGRTRARRAVVAALLPHLDAAELAAAFARIEAGLADGEGRVPGRVRAFVLSRALLGAMRSAVLEGVDFLLDRTFEDELVLLARGYLAHAATRERAQRGA